MRGKVNRVDYDILSKLNDNATENNRKQIEFVQPIINSIVNGTHGFLGFGETGRRRDGGEYDSLSENSKLDGERNAIDGVLLHNSASEEGVEATKRARRERRERRLADMRQAIEDVATPLNVPVEVLESTDELTGRMARAKGFYNKATVKITVVLPNNNSVEDMMQTVLHEAVLTTD